LIHSEQPEVAEGLSNRRDRVWWTGIRLVCAHWCGNAKLLFAARNPGALGHKAVLPRNPFLDFLIRGPRTERFIIVVLPRPTMPSFLVTITHAGFWVVSFVLQFAQPAYGGTRNVREPL